MTLYPGILVYVAGPFSGATRRDVDTNIRAAEAVGLNVASLGAMPVVPHANTAHPNYEHVQPYPFWIAGTMALLRACAAVMLVPGWERSSGAQGEVADARVRGVPVFDRFTELARWLEGEIGISVDGVPYRRADDSR